MVATQAAREELYRRLSKVAEAFPTLYPDAIVPKVYEGFPINEPPAYFAVDEIVDTATMGAESTTGAGRMDFTVNVMCFARHVDRMKTANTLLAYIDAVFKAVMVDQRLRMSVDKSFPAVESAGTSADSSKRYIAAAAIGVKCSVFSVCPKDFKEVIQ